MPEFTRALRGMISVRGIGRAEHDGVFGPLLAARTAAEQSASPRVRIAAFDAERLRRGWTDAIDAMAAARITKAGPDRRALAARLSEHAAPALDALAAVERAAARAKESGDTPTAESWGAWIAAVQAVFDAADQFWFALEPELGARAAPPKAARGETARAFMAALLGASLSASLGASLVASDAFAQHVTVRVPGVSADSLRARGFDVVGAEPGATLVVADPAEQASMALRGWRSTVLRIPRSPVVGATGAAVVPTTVYRDYDDPARGIRHFIDSLVQNNPRVTVDTLGLSFQGRPMLAVKIGPKDDSPQRPNVLFMATYHAREWAATDMALRLIKYLAAPPGTNTRVDSLVQARDIWILPVANPDGYEYTFTGDRLWRKTRTPQPGGAVGVDMNRNHKTSWALDDVGSSPDPASDIFRGATPESEIETRNIVAFHAAHPPVASVSYHSYGGLLLFSPGAVYGKLSSDLPVYRMLAGTNQRSAVKDNLPFSARTYDSPNTSWTLYTTNGEYNDWATATFGALSFTPEITSGYENGVYYGFEFFDDETKLQQLFNDNLPFALDVIESSRDPLNYVSPTTFFHTDRVVLESVSPVVQATVPATMAAGAGLAAPNPLSFRIDSLAAGRYTRRLVAATPVRPANLSVSAGGQTANFSVLHINGAETAETGWTATQFVHDSTFLVAGKYSWRTSGAGELRSPAITVPTTSDTVSLVFWTRYAGNGFTELPFGDVNLSVDGGATFQRVMRLEGYAPLFYPEQVTIGGVKGKQLMFKFVPNGLPWNLDEIAVVAHGAVTSSTVVNSAVLVPSENPVHRSIVYFPWPFGVSAGDIQAYDFSGRLVWKTSVTAAGGNIAWDLNAARVANGVYVVIARSGTKTARLKLFVLRNGS